MVGLGVYGGFEVSMLTRTEQVFSWFLGDNNKKIAMLDEEERSEMLRGLALWKKLVLRAPGTMVGLIRAISIAMLTRYWTGVLAGSLPDPWRAALQEFVAVPIGIVVFLHGYYVHTTDMENAQVLALKSQDQLSLSEESNGTEEQIDVSTKVLVLICNLASQSARGLIAVNAIYTLLGIHKDPTEGLLNVMDPKMSCVLGLYCALEVGIANAKYFQPKSEKTLQERKKQAKQLSLFYFRGRNRVASASQDVVSDEETGINFQGGGSLHC